MSALARIRKTALQHEQERQYDKALALYARLLDGAEAGEEEVDVALVNRAGDLALRLGDTPRALGYFERALDLYAAGGMLNNAVALGVKILRHAPAHLTAHYTLGVLYGRKGFAGDARHHLLTYAVQMQRAGRADEAGRVLGEVAAACLDAGERRGALDAYGALGGDPAQAAALSTPAPSAPAAPPHATPAPAPPAVPVAWGAVDFEPTVFVSPEPPVPIEPSAAPLLADLVAFDPEPEAPASQAPVAWDALGIEPLDVAFDEVAAGLTHPPAEVVVARAAPTWDASLGDEPPPLRLAELLRLDAPPLATVGETLPPVAPASDGPVWLVEPAAIALADDPPSAFPDPALADAYDVALDLPLVHYEPAVVDDDVEAPAPSTATAPAPASVDPDDALDLGAWLRETAEPASTRLTTAVVPQSGDEQADFDATLRAFTAGVTRAVDHEDWDSHYDLGVAFREMGLIDEAIVEFQRAARAPGRPLRALEALAQCFLDAGQPEVALSTLRAPAEAAADLGSGDAALVGVHYLMAVAAQALGRPDDARRWLVRVVATDVRFRDAAARLAALPPPSPVR